MVLVFNPILGYIGKIMTISFRYSQTWILSIRAKAQGEYFLYILRQGPNCFHFSPETKAFTVLN